MTRPPHPLPPQQIHPAPDSRTRRSARSASTTVATNCWPHRPTPTAPAPHRTVIAVGRTWKIGAVGPGARECIVSNEPDSPQSRAPSPSSQRMRLGIFGGSFDPVHNGHLALARCCQRQAALDEVWFTPTAIQPLKHAGPQATNAAASRNAAASNRRRTEHGAFARSKSTAAATATPSTRLRQIHTELPDAELFFLIGADALRDVPHWKEPARDLPPGDAAGRPPRRPIAG